MMNVELSCRTFAACLISAVALGLTGCAGPGRSEGESWDEQRFVGVVRQSLDYSCGAASVATILSHFYGRSASEADVLKRLPDLDEDFAASLRELELAVASFGFRGVPLRLDLAGLEQAKVPVILLLDVDGRGHFVVWRGFDQTRSLVHLADPSLGNRIVWRWQLEEWWAASERGAGYALLIVPQAAPPSERWSYMSDDSVFQAFTGARSEILRMSAVPRES